jgi:hypothetical protein
MLRNVFRQSLLIGISALVALVIVCSFTSSRASPLELPFRRSRSRATGRTPLPEPDPWIALGRV